MCESDKTESRPLDRKPTVPLRTLQQRVIFPAGRDEDTLTTLAARLAGALLRAFDPDAIAERATGKPGALPQEVAAEDFAATQQQLIEDICAPFDKPALRRTLEDLKKEIEQTIDIYTPDDVLSKGFDVAAREKGGGLVQAFRDYLTEHQTEIDALQILYSRPFKQRLTEPMLKELEKKLRQENQFGPDPASSLWRAFEVTANQVTADFADDADKSLPSSAIFAKSAVKKNPVVRFADLVSLVRFALEQQPVLAPFADSVSERFSEWLMDKAKSGFVFTPEQLTWLTLIRDHIATSLSIEADDFDYSPFSQQGGLGKAWQLFGDQLPTILEELNGVLVA